MAEENITAVAYSFSFSDFSLLEFFEEAKPVLLFLVAIFFYSLFIFKFYRWLATNRILELKLSKYSKTFTGYIKYLMKIVYYIIENLIVIPILVFFWFAVFAVMLMVISKETSAATILLVSIALVGAVRVASYYNEELAQEIAKTVPFAMLAIFLMDITFFSYEEVINIAMSIPGLWKQLLYYLMVVVLIEYIMRLIKGIFYLFNKEGREEAEAG